MHAKEEQPEEKHPEVAARKKSRKQQAPPHSPTRATCAMNATIAHASATRAAPSKSIAAGSNKRATKSSKLHRANIHSMTASPDHSASPPTGCNHPAEIHATTDAAKDANPIPAAISAAKYSTRHSKSPQPRPAPRGIP